MNQQRKAKKPAKIKGEIRRSMIPIRDERGLTIRFDDRPQYLLLPIDNPDALVEQGAKVLHEVFLNGGNSVDGARALLRSIGVPIKAKRAQKEATT